MDRWHEIIFQFRQLFGDQYDKQTGDAISLQTVATTEGEWSNDEILALSVQCINESLSSLVQEMGPNELARVMPEYLRIKRVAVDVISANTSFPTKFQADKPSDWGWPLFATTRHKELEQPVSLPTYPTAVFSYTDEEYRIPFQATPTIAVASNTDLGAELKRGYVIVAGSKIIFNGAIPYLFREDWTTNEVTLYYVALQEYVEGLSPISPDGANTIYISPMWDSKIIPLIAQKARMYKA